MTTGTTRRSSRPRPAPSPDRLAERLVHACGGASDTMEISLTATAAGVLLLGTGSALLRPSLQMLAESPISVTKEFWSELVVCQPFLDGHLSDLLGWMLGRQHSGYETALSRCYRVLTDVDLHATAANYPARGDLLGPLYTALRPVSSVRHLGAFYTPMAVSELMAAMILPDQGDSINEPACGAGGMAIATAKAMRNAGRDPGTCSWTLNDIDPLAVALAGVNFVVHGLGDRVTLQCGNALLHSS